MSAANEYHFVTDWLVEGSIEEIMGVLADTPSLVRWWPSVYLEVTELDPGSPKTGVGRRLELLMKGWLSYTVRWQLLVTDGDPQPGFSLDASGELVGQGVWTFRREGSRTAITYDWWVRADKPLRLSLSFLMKPGFAANHRWVMRPGERSVKLELASRPRQDTGGVCAHSPTARADAEVLGGVFGEAPGAAVGDVGYQSCGLITMSTSESSERKVATMPQTY